jgi:lipopolysaccharide export LptBFGC system permease protein LptF
VFARRWNTNRLWPSWSRLLLPALAALVLLGMLLAACDWFGVPYGGSEQVNVFSNISSGLSQ